ncbi:hypothetical protein OAU91_01245 [Flavobacteriaceae bacterium]|nr:hypothetical protein [Flavobacteriaceae bacterium]
MRYDKTVFAAGLKATVTYVEKEQSQINPQETKVMYYVTFDEPKNWINSGFSETIGLNQRWPASSFDTIEDDGVRPVGYVDHSIDLSMEENAQADMGGGRKTRKRKGGFIPGQIVEIKWPNKDGSFRWWRAGIIADKGGPEISVHWLGLVTREGFPLHEKIKRPPRSHVRIPPRGGTRKQKGGHHLYKRLGVSKYASQKQIRKAFKGLKKKRKVNKKVKEAYKILSNKKTRKQYNNKYRKAVKRGGKRKTRRRKGGNENCYSFRNLEDSKLCKEIHGKAQYYNTNHPEKLSRGQKIARKFKNKIRKRPKPENQQQVAQQKQAAFLKFKDKLHPVLGKLKEAEDKIRKKIKDTVEGPDDPTGEKQRKLEARYDKAFSNTNEKLTLMKIINDNLNSDKCPLPAQIEKARRDYSNRGRIPLAPRNVAFNVPY